MDEELLTLRMTREVFEGLRIDLKLEEIGRGELTFSTSAFTEEA